MVEDELLARGGVATRAQLVAATSRREVDEALRAGKVTVLTRGRYALSSTDAAVVAAHRLSGVLTLESAALRHGWAVKTVGGPPHVAVPRNRRIRPGQATGVVIHYRDLTADDVDGDVTSREATLLHCLRELSFDAALAVADSALRDGERAMLRRVAAEARGAGAAQVRRVAAQARDEAANPFESVLRALALRVPGWRPEPQRWVELPDRWIRPDLVDEDLRIILEADSFEWHGSRSALRDDARRYDDLVAAGWLVLRFAWEDVMFDQEWVVAVIRKAVEQRLAGTFSRAS
jgi:very-short-patch-repair endonuclease